MDKRKPIPKSIRLMLYDKYHHRCAYCGCKIEYKDMQIDHIKSFNSSVVYYKTMTANEVNATDNLLPACRQCNFYKSTYDIEKFRANLLDTLLPNIQKTFQFKLAKKYGLVDDKPKTIKFYFESEEFNN